MKKFFPKRIGVRLVVQAFFFLFLALISINHTLAEAGGGLSWFSSASSHALCPFGGVVSIYQFLTLGTLIPKTHDSSLILMLIGIALAVLFGPVICGWVCPLGTFQEWLSALGRKIFGRRYNHFIPPHIDRVLRYLRYFVLALVVYITATTVTLAFVQVDPYFALFNFWSSEATIGGLIVLGLTILTSMFIERPWCKYLCPYGAFLGLFNLLRIFSIRRTASTCKMCKVCDVTCPMNIPVSEKATIRDHQCITCLECTSEAVCPVTGTVDLSSGGRS